MQKFYAVAVGNKRGIYLSWEKCREQVLNYKGALFKKYNTREEAVKFLEEQEKEQGKAGLGLLGE